MMTINELATETGTPMPVMKKHLATLEKRKHWRKGRYNKTYLTEAGEKRLRELLDAAPEPEVVEDVAQFEAPHPQPVEVNLGSNTLADRLLSGHDTAVVKMTRLPNPRLLLVEHQGKDVHCLCRDNRFFVPRMKIAVRWVGNKLASVFQPRKIGRF